MKKILSVILILALSLSAVGAIAEETAEQPTAQIVTTDEKDVALEEALAAYKVLKGSTRVKNLNTLKQELEGFVAEGKLTQEQADLILKYYTEKLAVRGQKSSKSQEQQQLQQPGKQNGRGKQQRQQPTNNGEQNRQQRQQRQQNQPNGDADVDTTSGATTTKKGK